MPRRARIAGTGMSVGNRVVTNADMTQWMDTTEEWIEQRTGILERRWVDDTQKPSTLARDATLGALVASLGEARRRRSESQTDRFGHS